MLSDDETQWGRVRVRARAHTCIFSTWCVHTRAGLDAEGAKCGSVIDVWVPGIGAGRAELGSACKVVGGEDSGASVGSPGPTPAAHPARGTA